MNIHELKTNLKSLSDLLQQMQIDSIGNLSEQEKIRKDWEEANIHIGAHLSNIHEEEKAIYEEYIITIHDFNSIFQAIVQLDKDDTERGRQILAFNQTRSHLHQSTSQGTGMLGLAESQSRDFEQKRQSISNNIHFISNDLQRFIQSDK